MTVLTNMLDLRLDKLLQRLRQLQIDKFGSSQGSLADDGKPWNQKTEYIEFWQQLDQCKQVFNLVMRELTGLQKQRAHLQGQLRGIAHDQRWREQSRISSLDNDLQRTTRKAAAVAHALLELTRSGGEISLLDIVQGIRQLADEMGKTMSHMQVHATVQKVSDEPSFVTAQPQNQIGSIGDLLFLLIALLATLAKTPKQN